MSAGRVVGTLISCAAVAGCAAVVVGMARAERGPATGRDRAAVAEASPLSTPATRHAVPIVVPSTSAASSTSLPAPSTTAPSTSAPSSTVPPVISPPTSAAAGSAAPAPAVTFRPAVTTAPSSRPVTRAVVPRATHAAPAPVQRPAAAPTTKAKPAPKPAGQKLPLGYGTGTATRVVTVTAGSSRSTRATLQAWTKLRNGRWQKYGSSIRAYVGSAGIGTASESTSKTPKGSWTITQAFGRRANPGTHLPYTKTTPNDYWISSRGSKYNTRQRCGHCGYNNGVNERLYYVTPQYDYAAVIDYNTRNAPGGVKQGRGSAFFLHVSSGEPTAGCVAIPRSRLVPLLRWLTPTAHPRILIGVT